MNRAWPVPRVLLAAPSLSVSPMAARQALHAGVRPKRIPVASETADATASTARSTEIGLKRGNSGGMSLTSSVRPKAVMINPANPPMHASSTFSVSNCRISRNRPAPMAARMASSLWRVSVRAS